MEYTWQLRDKRMAVVAREGIEQSLESAKAEAEKALIGYDPDCPRYALEIDDDDGKGWVRYKNTDWMEA